MVDTPPEINLALQPGVTVEASVNSPTGRSARDPNVLLNANLETLDGQQPLSAFLKYRSRMYSTYDGHNAATAPDWYAIHFPEPVTFNCIEMTMERSHRDGGWWTSLDVEIQAEGEWIPVQNFAITPPYHFEDVAYGRRPYETHALTFHEVSARDVRIIGMPGGLAQFTALTRLAVYHRDLSRWNPATLPTPPVPYLFRLIAPQTIWDLSESLVKLTGLQVHVPFMDHYLDKERYERWWSRIRNNYYGEPELWHFIGALIGWETWNRIETPEEAENLVLPKDPHIRFSFHNTMGSAVASIIVDHQVLGEMTSHLVIIKDGFDLDLHKHYAAEHQLPWKEYYEALKRSPSMSLEQLEGAASLMGMIANTIANLAHRNLTLERELVGARIAQEQRRRDIVRKAIDYMQENLEAPVSVADVARAFAISPTYFGVLFAEVMGTTPIEYLIDLRIERAKTYLAHSQMSVMDVCLALGYDPSYFTRLFRKHTGFTPGQFARKMRGT